MNNHLPWKSACLTAVLALGVSAGALADSHSADLDHLADEVLAGGCAGCHGTDGALSGLVPAIAGRPAEELEALLLQYKNGEGNPTVMDRIAGGFTDEELTRLAEFFANR
ncbi:MAG: c-type cytochrome [Natronospirillum sp.]|uniref:c-type cytochrome n=1 Tax=Natronospirillum sp. TaxID=2812955 RepID=UPI0025EC006D|nr:c-type cytochrome [Natronospirillum sp.]MCH8551213.1 c-type cytochrome [Natronospirillum sp.]